MEQNIRDLLQIPKSPFIFQEIPSQFSELTGETKNQPDRTRATLSKASKRFQNIGILSPEILKSYQLDENLLSHTPISEIHRAKMRLWIAANCHVRKLSFQTASLACYIMDLYFTKGGLCSLEDFQYLGICCFRIANKMEDNYLIAIDYEMFKREKLIEMEASICLQTCFELNPITYTEISHTLLYFWNVFQAKIKDEGAKRTQDGLKFEDRVSVIQLEFAFTLLHEFLELAFLSTFYFNKVLKTLKFSLDVVVSSAFFLIFCLQIENKQNALTVPQIKDFIRKYQGSESIWKCFESFCQEIGSKIKVGFQEDCLQLLFPIYNFMIAEGNGSKGQKDQEVCLDPNLERFRLKEGDFSQSNNFKEKLGSFKKYMRRQSSERVRKCSEVTHI